MLNVCKHPIDQKEYKEIEKNNEKWLNELKLRSVHRHLVIKVGNIFESTKESLKEQEAILVFDFMQDLKLVEQYRQEGKVFYEHPVLSVFGIVLLFRSKGNIIRYNYTFVSSIHNKGAFFVIDCFELLRGSDSFKQLNLNKLFIFCDGGAALKCKQLLRYFNVILSKGFTNGIELEYFIEHHSKSLADQHFAILKRAIHYTTIIPNNAVTSLQAVVECLTSKFPPNTIDLKQVESGYKHRNEVIELDQHRKWSEKLYMDFESIRLYYYYRFANGKIYRSLIKDYEETELTNLIDKTQTVNLKPSINKTAPEAPDGAITELSKQTCRTLHSRMLLFEHENITPEEKKDNSSEDSEREEVEEQVEAAPKESTPEQQTSRQRRRKKKEEDEDDNYEDEDWNEPSPAKRRKVDKKDAKRKQSSPKSQPSRKRQKRSKDQ